MHNINETPNHVVFIVKERGGWEGKEVGYPPPPFFLLEEEHLLIKCCPLSKSEPPTNILLLLIARKFFCIECGRYIIIVP